MRVTAAFGDGLTLCSKGTIGFHPEETYTPFMTFVFVTLCSVDEILHQFLISFLKRALFNDTFQLRYVTERVI